MLNLKWMIVCKRVLEDKGSNLLSLIDCVEGFVLGKKEKDSPEPKYPINIPASICVALTWDREAEDKPEYNCRIRTLSSDNKEGVTIKFSISFSSAAALPQSLRTIINMPNLLLPGPEKLFFIVEVEQNGKWVEFGKQYLRYHFDDKKQD